MDKVLPLERTLSIILLKYEKNTPVVPSAESGLEGALVASHIIKIRRALEGPMSLWPQHFF